MKDIMIDLETVGTEATAGIFTIGALEFNPFTGETGKEFYRIIELQSCIDAGLTIDASTIYWWLVQSKAARTEIVETNRTPIKVALDEFIKFCGSVAVNDLSSKGTYPDIRLWGNGSDFDNAKLQYVYFKCGKKYPIDFWNSRDVRTVVGFYPQTLFKEWKTANLRSGYHNALEDCKYQIKYVNHIIKELGVTELY
jgi:exodeoxyribonuclease VIII